MSKKSLYTIIPFIILLFITIASCSNRPKSVLSKGQMEDVLYDYHIARSMASNLSPEQMYKQRYYVQGVFDKYHITEAQFDSSMVWYSRHAEDMADIYKNVQERLKDDIDKINSQIAENQHNPTGAASGDSLDIWTFSRNTHLTDDDLHNKLTFSITPDTTFHPRDILEWNINFIGTGMPDPMHGTVMMLSIRYENDSTITQTVQLNGSGMRSLRIQNNLPVPIRKVNGLIFMPKGAHNTLALHIRSLMRYHAHGDMPQGGGPNGMPGSSMPNGQPMPPNGQPAPSPTGINVPGSAANGAPNAAKPDTSKTLPQGPHRLMPEELNKKRTDDATPHGYQLRQQALEKQLQQRKPKQPAKTPTTK